MEDEQRYVKNALYSISREKGDEISINYYSTDGAAYIDLKKMQVKTAYPKGDKRYNRGDRVLPG